MKIFACQLMFSEKYDFLWLLYECTILYSCKPLSLSIELPLFTDVNSAATNILRTNLCAMILMTSLGNIAISGIAKSKGVNVLRL